MAVCHNKNSKQQKNRTSSEQAQNEKTVTEQALMACANWNSCGTFIDWTTRGDLASRCAGAEAEAVGTINWFKATYHNQVASFHVAPHQDCSHILLILKHLAHVVFVVLENVEKYKLRI